MIIDESPINLIKFEKKGSYCEVIIQKDHEVWKMLLNEKNLTILLLQGKEIIQQMRKEG